MEIWDITSLEIEPHLPQVLHSDEGVARVIAVNLPAGEELQDHEVHEHAWLHVHEGSVALDGDGTTRRVGSGGLAHWRPGERHAVHAVEDTRLLLLLVPWPGSGHPNERAEVP